MTILDLVTQLEEHASAALSDGHSRRAFACDDVMTLCAAIREQRNAVLEEAASLYDSIDPACDHERLDKIPGAGAMGVVLRYRDAIRKLKSLAGG